MNAPDPASAGVVTDRLRLVRMRECHLASHARLCADPETMQFVGAGRALSHGEAMALGRVMLDHWARLGYGPLMIETLDGGELIGRTGLWRPPDWAEPELVWLLGRSWWGQGYAMEAVQAARRIAAAQWQVVRPASLIHPENRHSLKLAQRIGAKFEREIGIRGVTVQCWRHAPVLATGLDVASTGDAGAAAGRIPEHAAS